MKFILSILLAAGIVSAQTQLPYAQCGGLDWDYTYLCPANYTCNIAPGEYSQTPRYQCLPSTGPIVAHAFAYGMCGGIEWTGAKLCIPGYKCTESNQYFWECFENETIATISNPTPNLASPGDYCGAAAVQQGRATECIPGYYCSEADPQGFQTCLLGADLSASSTIAAPSSVLTTLVTLITATRTSS